MTTTIDFDQTYQEAETAYSNGQYEEAAQLVVSLVQYYPDDARARLLCGNIYCYGLKEYAVAREQYEGVLQLTNDPGLIEYAHIRLQDLEDIVSNHGAGSAYHNDISEDDTMLEAQKSNGRSAVMAKSAQSQNGKSAKQSNNNGASQYEDLDAINTDDLLDEINDPDTLNDIFANPFDLDDDQLAQSPPKKNTQSDRQSAHSNQPPKSTKSTPLPTMPAATIPLEEDLDDEDFDFPTDQDLLDLEVSSTDFTTPEIYNQQAPNQSFVNAHKKTESPYTNRQNRNTSSSSSASGDDPFADDELAEFDDIFASLQPFDDELDDAPGVGTKANNNGNGRANYGNFASEPAKTSNSRGSKMGTGNNFEEVAEEDTLLMSGDDSKGQEVEPSNVNNNFEDDFSEDNFDDDEFDNFGGYQDDAFDLDEEPPIKDPYISSQDFDQFGSDIPSFSKVGETSSKPSFSKSNQSNLKASFMANTGSGFSDSDGSSIRDEEMFSISAVSEALPTFTPIEEEGSETTVNVEQGSLAFLENASLMTKNIYIAVGTGLVSLIAVAFITNATASQAMRNSKGADIISHLQQTGWIMTAAAGVSSFCTSLGLGWLVSVRHINRATEDLQNQFDAVSQGNLGARANIYSEDEFGHLANKFNRMAKVIVRTTTEAQRKADEQEQAKEDLQRQVIRLLDDVEGAARGDLTVQAEVTADVLGAVADSFNLTIQNLREIVQQVKVAARQVSKGATESELFARGLSSDALRQAEELAATLNSVQVLTDAIQRVAESAREAEEVARAAAATAAKGGEAVERTVAGILDIRETVADTTRKVKRLAESAQEISKIVALISAIASRTNLLALNASIEAARAGEAGRGFALVADQVRQLADKSAKSLKEIEQIVMQIQSETGQVMTAMEEGTQQVIEGTKLAEQAKRSLEDIIQVTNRIDVLVRSITADTVEQNETARAVASVMQAVELTAQETSQEAQKVSVALQNLVGVARDLLTSVERFRVEASERH